MAGQDAEQDANQFPALIAHSNTTKDAETRKVVADEDGNLSTKPFRIADNPEFFEDLSFVIGDSPATLDLNDALGRNATQGTITNDGTASFTIAFSTNGTDFGDAITIKKKEKLSFTDISVDSLRLVTLATTAYRVVAV